MAHASSLLQLLQLPNARDPEQCQVDRHWGPPREVQVLAGVCGSVRGDVPRTTVPGTVADGEVRDADEVHCREACVV
jgi:hypothetical protein